jgi:hypothetical protein
MEILRTNTYGMGHAAIFLKLTQARGKLLVGVSKVVNTIAELIRNYLGVVVRNICEIILAGCLLLPSLVSCSSVTLHENFIMTMQSDIGKNLDDPTLSGWMQPARLIDNINFPEQ